MAGNHLYAARVDVGDTPLDLGFPGLSDLRVRRAAEIFNKSTKKLFSLLRGKGLNLLPKLAQRPSHVLGPPEAVERQVYRGDTGAGEPRNWQEGAEYASVTPDRYSTAYVV
jgi:hypothetical protein